MLAVEIDRGLIPILAESLAEYDNVEVIQGDILEQKPERLVGKKTRREANQGGRKSPLLHHNADFDEASGERTSD